MVQLSLCKTQTIPAIMLPDFPPTEGVALLHQSTASHDLFLLSNY